MSENCFLLPNVHSMNIKVKKENRGELLHIIGYSPELNNTKNKISQIKFSSWSKVRSMFNCLEFPFDSKKIRKPLSRAFFKLLELVKDHNISTEGNTLHLAEAPGGFIQATKYIKDKKGMKNDLYYTFSILGGKLLPIYNRILLNDPMVKVLSTKQNKGDLYDTKNIKYLIDTLSKENVMFITGDGGFDENDNFESKEQLHHHLIFNQIVSALFILGNGGTFIVKIFDIFTELTFDFIYLLSYLFSEVYIHKPDTSRPTNSEKYIVCKHFRKDLFTFELRSIIKKICVENVNTISSFIDKSTIDMEFVEKIRHVNVYFAETQIKSIEETIEIDRLDSIINKKEYKVKEWVDKYY